MIPLDEREALAAEFVLGTLDAAERDHAESLIQSEPPFAAAVQAWERRLAPLHAMVASVEPPPEIWDSLERRLAAAPRSPNAINPDRHRGTLPGRSAATPDDLERRLRRWRAAAITAGTFALIVAAGSAALIGAMVLAPEQLVEAVRLPPQAGRAVNSASVEKTAGAATGNQAPASGSARLVAVLQGEGLRPAFILTLDEASRTLTLRRIAAEPQAGKRYELWLLSDRLPSPKSLGPVEAGEVVRMRGLSAEEAAAAHGASFAISLEPDAGPPTGLPSAPFLWEGKLLDIGDPGPRP